EPWGRRAVLEDKRSPPRPERRDQGMILGERLRRAPRADGRRRLMAASGILEVQDGGGRPDRLDDGAEQMPLQGPERHPGTPALRCRTSVITSSTAAST